MCDCLLLLLLKKFDVVMLCVCVCVCVVVDRSSLPDKFSSSFVVVVDGMFL